MPATSAALPVPAGFSLSSETLTTIGSRYPSETILTVSSPDGAAAQIVSIVTEAASILPPLWSV